MDLKLDPFIQKNTNHMILTPAKWAWILSLLHLFLLSVSNILVQYPFYCFGYQTTWGAFSYPCIFILSDLTVRLTSAQFARKIIHQTLIPGLILSYFMAAQLEGSVLAFHPMPFRIALASFCAYFFGQRLDILIFQRIKKLSQWWLAPFISNSLSNVFDTCIFFSIAFYQCANPVLRQHWPEIACIDLCVKFAISSLAFLPIYGLSLHFIQRRFMAQSL